MLFCSQVVPTLPYRLKRDNRLGIPVFWGAGLLQLLRMSLLSSLSMGEVLAEAVWVAFVCFMAKGDSLHGCVTCLFSRRLKLAAIFSLSSSGHMLQLVLWYLWRETSQSVESEPIKKKKTEFFLIMLVVLRENFLKGEAVKIKRGMSH